MISVRNHQQLLNGNSLLLVLVSILFLSSCGIFSNKSSKRPRHRTRTNKKTKIKKNSKNNVDSLQWPGKKSNKESQTEDNTYGSVKKSNYVIDLLIPLDANRHFENLEKLEVSSTNKFLHYYTGVMMALEDLEKEGISITLNVMDAPIKNNRISTIKSKIAKDKPDVIIGPYVKSQIKEIAYYSKRKEITMVNPWNAFSSVASDNPNYIQLKPNLNKYYEAIIKDIDSKYSADDVYLIGLNDKYHKRRLSKFQKLHLTDKGVKEYNIFIINKDSLDNGETAFDSLFTKDKWKTKVFILPNWSFKDEIFMYSALRRINIEKSEQKVIVYGLPQVLLNSTKIGYNLFKRLNIRVASQNYMDIKSYAVKSFKNRFYKRTNTFPEKNNYANDGYDMMMFVGRNLHAYGTKFQYFIENKEQHYLNSTIQLIRNVSSKDIRAEKLDKINYFENNRLFILGFKFNKFEKLN